jgi:hypothetical protein
MTQAYLSKVVLFTEMYNDCAQFQISISKR